MTRCAWVLVVGVGLSASLAPGCAYTDQQTATDRHHLVEDHGPWHAMPPTAAAQPGSPYHMVPGLAGAKAPDRQLEGLPDSVSGNAPAPLPPPVPETVELTRRSTTITELQAPAQLAARPRLTLPPEAQQQLVEEAPIVAALRCYLQKRPAEAVTFLERYDKLHQDLLICLLPVAARLSEGSLAQASPQEVSALLAQLNSVLQPLQPAALLAISKMCLCRSVEKFGSYEAFPVRHGFRLSTLVQVYVELQNFTSERHGSIYRTRLASSLCIRDRLTQVVWRQDFPEGSQPDLSRTPRHDYFLNCCFRVPQLPPGPYTLSIQVTDVPTRRTAERTVDFDVAPWGVTR